MIIKSRVARSPFYRQTHVAEPAKRTLHSLIGELLVQWNVVDQAQVTSTNLISSYALVISLGTEDERLLIDKEQEWTLFLAGSSSDVLDVVQVELLLLDSVSSSSSSSSQRGNDNRIHSNRLIELEADLRRLSAKVDEVASSRLPTTQQDSSQPAKPKSYAFHSVEPQAVKSSSNTQEHRETGQTSSATAPSTDPPAAAMSLDEIMARSRRQGESLNHLFGSLQARNAGTAYTPESHQNSEATHDQSQTSTGQGSAAGLPAPEQSSVMPTDEEQEETSTRQQKPKEEVTQMNSYIDNLWQDRLTQMGHGPDSGSVYAKIRMGKLKGTTSSDVNAENFPSSSSVELSHSDTTPTLSNPSGGLVGASTLIPLDEVNEDQLNSRHQSQDNVQSSTALRGSLDESTHSQKTGLTAGTEVHQSTSAGGSTADVKSSTFRPRFFKHRRGVSDVVRPSSSLQASETATPEGAMTPRSFNSALFRRRTLSVRSLSDALLGTAREQARNAHNNEDVERRLGGSTAPGTPSKGSRLQQIRRTSARSLTELVVRPRKQSKPDKYVDRTKDDGKTTHERKTIECTTTSIRPTLLRASHSSPMSSTAVNLSSVGGITLHASSIGPLPFTRDSDAVGSARRASLGDTRVKPARDLFDIMLPREMRIKCLRALIQLHEDEAEAELGNGIVTRSRGKRSAMRELMRLSRVSRSWQSLILDGQLWPTLDASLAHGISDESLLRITRQAGPFIKSLDLGNMHNLSSALLVAMTSPPQRASAEATDKRPSRAVRASTTSRLPTSITASSVAFASLRRLNLQSCRNLSTDALHHALARMPHLEHLNISNMSCVNNNTCLLLGATLPRLLSLNVSRCSNVSGDGVISFINAAQGCLYDRALFSKSPVCVEADNIGLDMQQLRAVGLHDVDGVMMEHVGRAMRKLRVLDLSYVSDLNDEAVAAFVRHPGPSHLDRDHAISSLVRSTTIKSHRSPSGPFVVLTQRQAGGNVLLDGPQYRRIHPHLVHLKLSSCRSLTDRMGVYLAHAVPKLKCIELANVGNSLRDEGLVKLLESTPEMERIDVEGATELGDAFLRAITPSAEYVESLGLEMQTNDLRSEGRRSRRVRQKSAVERQGSHSGPVLGEPFAAVSVPSLWTQSVPCGAKLSHLIVSHLSRLSADALLTLVRRCPKLVHLEVDDTRANDALLHEFVSLARQRQKHGAYVSLVDCRALSKSANASVFAEGQARPRAGQRDQEYEALDYFNGANQRLVVRKDASSSLSSTTPNDFDDSLVVVKTFWAWQAVDVRVRAKRRAEAKRTNKAGKMTSAFGNGRMRRDSLAAALSYLGNGNDDDDVQGRWARMASGLLLGQGDDEGEDARGCRIM